MFQCVFIRAHYTRLRYIRGTRKTLDRKKNGEVRLIYELPSHLAEKARMAIGLLNGGYVRKINHKQIETMLAESIIVSSPPLQVQMRMIKTLMELPQNRVCPLKYLARTCIVKRLRTKRTNNITQCIQTLTKTQNLPLACQDCLTFK